MFTIQVGEHGVIRPEEGEEQQGCTCRHDQEEEEEEDSSDEESEEEEEEEEEASTDKKPYCVGKKVADEAPVANFVDVAVGTPKLSHLLTSTLTPALLHHIPFVPPCFFQL